MRSRVIDVLIPTCNRAVSLVMTLSGVASQTCPSMRVIVADQSEEPVEQNRVVQALRRIIEARGHETEWHYRVPSKGIAEQRQFLLDRSTADYLLYLDDDVYMEPHVIQSLFDTIATEECGFVGAFPSGLSFLNDVRPQQQIIEYWNGPIRPEVVKPDSITWDRAQLHRAANGYHVGLGLPRGRIFRYKVAWVACCVLYDRAKLLDVGGFSFWSRLPRYHSGEEVLVQNLLMRKYGGCAILPSGTYHSEMESTVLNREGKVDGHALELLEEMIEKYLSPKTPAV